jgi:hypothetical protein
MSIPTCKCCRRWKKVVTNLLEGCDDDDENEDCRGGGGCTDTDKIMDCTTNIQRERKISIPIQLRLAIVRTITNPHLGKTTTVATTTATTSAQDILSYEASPMNSKHLIYFPPLSLEDETTASSSTTAADAAAITATFTISNFIQYVVDDLLIGNKEANFWVHDQSYFINMLLGSIYHEGRTTPDISFRHERNTTYRLSGGEEGCRHHTRGQSSSPCVVEFTLLDPSEEGHVGGIQPWMNAHETFCYLLSTQGNSSSKTMVDLILKAHVMISTTKPLTTQKSQSSSVPVLANDSSTKRKPISDYCDGINTKRRKWNTEVIWTSKYSRQVC